MLLFFLKNVKKFKYAIINIRPIKLRKINVSHSKGDICGIKN